MAELDAVRMNGLVLSTFPGIGMLDKGFEEEGYCVVRGPDVLWGGDIHDFHPPAGVFEGVIGGPPCQAFSSLANLVRAKGLEPKWGNLIPEFSRCCAEAVPEWFLMENVPAAPEPEVPGYDVTSFLLDNCWLGEAQMRKRRFSFGCVGEAPNLRRWIPGVALELAETTNIIGPSKWGEGRKIPDSGRPATKQQAVAADSRAVPERLGGSGKVKVTADGGHDGVCKSGQLVKQNTVTQRGAPGDVLQKKQAPVTGRHDGKMGAPDKDYSPPRRTLAEMLELQGFPPDWLDHQPWTMQAKRKMVGNGVPLPMARAVAAAVRKSTRGET